MFAVRSDARELIKYIMISGTNSENVRENTGYIRRDFSRTISGRESRTNKRAYAIRRRDAVIFLQYPRPTPNGTVRRRN